MNTLSAEEQARASSILRPKEQLLWAGKPRPSVEGAQRGGILARLCKLFGGSSTPDESTDELYLITSKRVIILPRSGEPQEWFLMLGMVQAVEERSDGSGDIILDYDLNITTGERTPRGLLRLPEVGKVAPVLNSAIDAAYNASPWSV